MRKNRYRYPAILFFSLLFTNLFAAEKYQIVLQLSPSYEILKIRGDTIDKIFQYKFSYNFGFEYKHFTSPDFSLSVGLQYQSKGYRTEIEFTTTDTAKDVFARSNLIVSADYIMLPLGMNGHIRLAKRTNCIISTGLSAGYLVRQYQNGKKVPEEIAPKEFNGQPVRNGVQNINQKFFNNKYLGWYGGVGISQAIKAKMIIEVQAVYTRQINRAIPLDSDIVGYVGKPKLDSFALDLKIGYYFNRQIQQKQKDF